MNVWVVQTDTGWELKPEGRQAVSPHRTQELAMDAARDLITNNGGGELIVQGRDGKIVRKDTIPPKRDKFPPRG